MTITKIVKMEYLELSKEELDIRAYGMSFEDLDYEKHRVSDLQSSLLMNTWTTAEEEELYDSLDRVYGRMDYYEDEIWQYYYKKGIEDEETIKNANMHTIEKTRTQERSQIIKEELIAKALHPNRVERWLEIGGFELLDTLL
jgi:hypothetical protein